MVVASRARGWILIGTRRSEPGETCMKNYTKLAAAAVFGLGALALTATSAAAAIACNAEGECWHVHRNYVYHPEWGIVIHPDGWVWGPNENYFCNKPPGGVYWHSGVWVHF